MALLMALGTSEISCHLLSRRAGWTVQGDTTAPPYHLANAYCVAKESRPRRELAANEPTPQIHRKTKFGKGFGRDADCISAKRLVMPK